jgi:ABC-type branched-subunit amino acid transport system permease subunit
MSLVLAFVAMGATDFLMRSSTGIGVTAMRDDEAAAGTIGVNLFRARHLLSVGGLYPRCSK